MEDKTILYNFTQEEFDLAFSQQYKTLIRYLMCQFNDAALDDAMDAATETFKDLARYRSRITSREHARNWVYFVAPQKYLRIKKKKDYILYGNKEKDYIDWITEITEKLTAEEEDLVLMPHIDTQEIDREIEKKLIREIMSQKPSDKRIDLVREALSELTPEHYRIILYLRFFANAPVRVIARILDIEEKKVENTIYRAKVKLASILEEKSIANYL